MPREPRVARREGVRRSGASVTGTSVLTSSRRDGAVREGRVPVYLRWDIRLVTRRLSSESAAANIRTPLVRRAPDPPTGPRPCSSAADQLPVLHDPCKGELAPAPMLRGSLRTHSVQKEPRNDRAASEQSSRGSLRTQFVRKEPRMGASVPCKLSGFNRKLFSFGSRERASVRRDRGGALSKPPRCCAGEGHPGPPEPPDTQSLRNPGTSMSSSETRSLRISRSSASTRGRLS